VPIKRFGPAPVLLFERSLGPLFLFETYLGFLPSLSLDTQNPFPHVFSGFVTAFFVSFSRLPESSRFPEKHAAMAYVALRYRRNALRYSFPITALLDCHYDR